MGSESERRHFSNLHIRCAFPGCRISAIQGLVIEGRHYCCAEHARKNEALLWVQAKLRSSGLDESRMADNDAICNVILEASNTFCDLLTNDTQDAAISEMDAFLADSISETTPGPALVLQFSRTF